MWKNFSSVKSFLLLFLMLLVWSGCAKDLVTGKKTYNWFGFDYDIKLGRQVIGEQLKELKKHKKKVDEEADPKLTEKIREITRRIAEVSHQPQFPYEAHFADVAIVNAWCAPGGKVMVYRGLFDPKEGLVKEGNEDELAAVLGHEIAHATARHVTESMSRNLSLLIVGQAAAIAVSASGASTLAQNMFNRVLTQGLNLYLPAYSRKNESEADRIGIFYMAKAGYNPQAAVDLWYRACKKRGDKTSLYASHPADCQRAKNLEKLLPRFARTGEAGSSLESGEISFDILRTPLLSPETPSTGIGSGSARPIPQPRGHGGAPEASPAKKEIENHSQ